MSLMLAVSVPRRGGHASSPTHAEAISNGELSHSLVMDSQHSQESSLDFPHKQGETASRELLLRCPTEIARPSYFETLLKLLQARQNLPKVLKQAPLQGLMHLSRVLLSPPQQHFCSRSLPTKHRLPYHLQQH